MASINPFIWLFGDPAAKQAKISKKFLAAQRRLILARKRGDKQGAANALRDMSTISKFGRIEAKKDLYIANTPDRVTETASSIASSVSTGVKVASLGGFALAAFGLWVVLRK